MRHKVGRTLPQTNCPHEAESVNGGRFHGRVGVGAWLVRGSWVTLCADFDLANL